MQKPTYLGEKCWDNPELGIHNPMPNGFAAIPRLVEKLMAGGKSPENVFDTIRDMHHDHEDEFIRNLNYEIWSAWENRNKAAKAGK